jgi:hypothetical protein
MATKRAEVVSMTNLAKAVDRAVVVAAKRHDAVLEKDTLLLNWEIVGRRIREFEGNPLQLAADISKNVNVAGIKAQPVATKFGKDIFVGFIERGLATQRFG